MIRMEINLGSSEVYQSPDYRNWLESSDEAYKDYRKQWSRNPIENRVNSFPLHISFESTNNCNLRCVFCSRTIKNSRAELGPIKNMSFSLFEKVILEGSMKGLKAIKFNTNTTEPLLVTDLAQRIALAKSLGILDVMFNTNATLLTKKKTHEILESGLDRIFISFDAPDKEVYEKLRVGANYEQVLENILRFCKMKREAGIPKPFVGIQMIRMKQTEPFVDKFIGIFRDHVDIIRIGQYNNYQQLNALDLRSTPQSGRDEFACSQLWQRLEIRSDGRVIPCCGDVNDKLVLGNAAEANLEEFWTGGKLNRLRKLHLAGRWREIETCRRCDLPYK